MTIMMDDVSNQLRLNAAVTVDLVVLTVREEALQVLAVRRGIKPYEGRLALPGGFIGNDEDLLDAAERELSEETGINGLRAHLEQLGTYGRPRRDPRGRVVTVAYLAMLPDLPMPKAGSDAAEADWRSVDHLLGGSPQLAFDHLTILRDGVERARSKLEYTTLATRFCAGEFTITELRKVYEAVWGVTIDPRNFHRKVLGTPGFVEETNGTTTRDGGRPARLYRPGAAKQLHPPLMQPDAA